MNSISGAGFREYISKNIHEADRWGHSMRLFGTFHNHMHEMMSDLARYAASDLGHDELMPEFEDRISGGEWGVYRENLERTGARSSWLDFVQITEIMHDRVHHAMYKSLVYDSVSRHRAAELEDYVGNRAPYAPEQTTTDRNELSFEFVSADDFRDLVWHRDFDGEHLHDAMQGMLVFDELLYVLMTDWAEYGAQHESEACRPPAFEARIGRAEWQAYASSLDACEDEAWRQFVVIAGLMHDRIHHMMYQMMVYDAETHDARSSPATGPVGLIARR